MALMTWRLFETIQEALEILTDEELMRVAFRGSLGSADTVIG